MMVIFGPLVGSTTSAVTLTLASLPASLVTVEPSTSRSGVRSMLSPASPFTLSMIEDVADGHLLLSAASADDRVHVELTL